MMCTGLKERNTKRQQEKVEQWVAQQDFKQRRLNTEGKGKKSGKRGPMEGQGRLGQEASS